MKNTLTFKNLYFNLHNIFKYINDNSYNITIYNKNATIAIFYGLDYTINSFINKDTMICEIEEGLNYKKFIIDYINKKNIKILKFTYNTDNLIILDISSFTYEK